MIMAAQPPGPGLFWHEPSVYITISIIKKNIHHNLLRYREIPIFLNIPMDL